MVISQRLIAALLVEALHSMQRRAVIQTPQKEVVLAIAAGIVRNPQHAEEAAFLMKNRAFEGVAKTTGQQDRPDCQTETHGALDERVSQHKRQTKREDGDPASALGIQQRSDLEHPRPKDVRAQ